MALTEHGAIVTSRAVGHSRDAAPVGREET